MTSISNGQFSVSWIKPQNSEKKKLLLLELDRALKNLRAIESYKFPVGKRQARNKVVAGAEKLLKAFAVELAEAQAEEATKAHCEQKENPFFK